MSWLIANWKAAVMIYAAGFLTPVLIVVIIAGLQERRYGKI
jgi:hypothetical protein